jgi:hypothetical protein
MRWAVVSHEKPSKPGDYYVWHPRLGKCVMGYNDGWGGQPPVYFLENDQCPHQAVDGSFGGSEVLT